MPLLNMPLPSLISLSISFRDTYFFRNSVESFPIFSPHVRELSVNLFRSHSRAYGRYRDAVTIESDFICRWKDLRSVDFESITLGRDALEHLSRMPALTRLYIPLPATLPAFGSPLSFSNLQYSTLYSESLITITCFLSHARLPAVTDFQALLGGIPSLEELPPFWTSLLTSNPGRTLKELVLSQRYYETSTVRQENMDLDSLEDLRPCMAFRNLRILRLNLKCNVCLSDSDLLTMASAWPMLVSFEINPNLGWNSEFGITPGGLVRLWQICPSLTSIALRLDTKGYTEVPSSDVPATLGLTFPSGVTVNVLDADLEVESLSAIATFFSGIAACCHCGLLNLRYWRFDFVIVDMESRWDHVVEVLRRRV